MSEWVHFVRFLDVGNVCLLSARVCRVNLNEQLLPGATAVCIPYIQAYPIVFGTIEEKHTGTSVHQQVFA